MDSSQVAPATAAPQALARLLGLLGIPGQVAVIALMLHVTADTVLRRATGQSMAGTLEFVQFWYMPAICLLGFVIAELQDEQITAPVLYDRASQRVRREFSLFGYGVTIALLLAYAWWGASEALTQMERGTTAPISGIVVWPAVFLVPLASTATAVAAVLSLMRRPWTETDYEEVGSLMSLEERVQTEGEELR